MSNLLSLEVTLILIATCVVLSGVVACSYLFHFYQFSRCKTVSKMITVTRLLQSPLHIITLVVICPPVIATVFSETDPHFVKTATLKIWDSKEGQDEAG